MKRALKYAIPVAAIIAQGSDEPATADVFIKIEGIEGESVHAKHQNEIDVLAWSWGVSNLGFEGGFGGGGGGGKSLFTPIKIIKSVDAATADLIAHAAIGAPIPEALLTVTQNGAEQEDYLRLTLNELIVSKVAHGGKNDQDGIAETVTLDWTSIKVEYRKQDAKGGFGPWEETCWDRSKNASC